MCLFSATMPKPIVDLSDNFMNAPIKILVDDKDVTKDGIKQFFVSVENDDQKQDLIDNLLEQLDINQMIMFANSKTSVENLTAFLLKKGFSIAMIHSELDRDQRTKVMQEFKDRKHRILVSSDLLARGIDIYSVNLVVNYEVPKSMETYIHRIGRTGRDGRMGVAISMVDKQNAKLLLEIEKHYQTSIEELPIDVADIYKR